MCPACIATAALIAAGTTTTGDDDIVPFEHLSHYAEKLPQATVRALDGRGHFFKDGLPELVDDIKAL